MPTMVASTRVTAGTNAASIRSSAIEVSCSKVSAVFSSIASSAPDSSPTWIICRASRGKRLPLPSAADRPMPFFTSSAAASTSFASTRLSSTLRAMPSAGSSGTPLRSRVPSVRASRAVSSLAASAPASLLRSSQPSNFSMKAGSRRLRSSHSSASSGIASNRNHQSRTNTPTPSTACENHGRSASRLSYIAENCGTT